MLKLFRNLFISTVLLLALFSCDPSSGTTGLFSLTIGLSDYGYVTYSIEEIDNIVEDTELVLTAVPYSGYKFNGWTGDIESEENPITVKMTSDLNIEADFSYNSERVFDFNIHGEGSVSKSPDLEVYDSDNRNVTLTAVPAAGYVFDYWEEDLEEFYDNPWDTRIYSSRIIDVYFTNEPRFSVKAFPENAGTVSSSASGDRVSIGSDVTLQSTANSGYSFWGWAGVDPVTTSSKTVTVNDHTYEYALFTSDNAIEKNRNRLVLSETFIPEEVDYDLIFDVDLINSGAAHSELEINSTTRVRRSSASSEYVYIVIKATNISDTPLENIYLNDVYFRDVDGLAINATAKSDRLKGSYHSDAYSKHDYHNLFPGESGYFFFIEDNVASSLDSISYSLAYTSNSSLTQSDVEIRTIDEIAEQFVVANMSDYRLDVSTTLYSIYFDEYGEFVDWTFMNISTPTTSNLFSGELGYGSTEISSYEKLPINEVCIFYSYEVFDDNDIVTSVRSLGESRLSREDFTDEDDYISYLHNLMSR